MGTDNLHGQFGSLETFRSTLATLESIEFPDRRVTSQTDSGATVSVSSVAQHSDRTDNCTGRATLVAEGSRWLVDHIDVNCQASKKTDKTKKAKRSERSPGHPDLPPAAGLQSAPAPGSADTVTDMTQPASAGGPIRAIGRVLAAASDGHGTVERVLIRELRSITGASTAVLLEFARVGDRRPRGTAIPRRRSPRPRSRSRPLRSSSTP